MRNQERETQRLVQASVLARCSTNTIDCLWFPATKLSLACCDSTRAPSS